MSQTTAELIKVFQEFIDEDTKFQNGNGAAGTRARKALNEMRDLVKTRRAEITAEKATRAEVKVQQQREKAAKAAANERT